MIFQIGMMLWRLLMDNKIPKYTHSIEAYYNECIQFDLEQLEIDVEMVSDWYIKYQRLYVTYNDGTLAEYDATHFYEMDYKRPDEMILLDKDRVQL